MLQKLLRQTFSNKITKSMGEIDSNIEEVLQQRQKIRRDIFRKQMNNLPAEQSIRNFYDSLVKITLYMRNDYWESQYLYLLLNYNKLGFQRVSDLVHLDRATYLLNLRKVDDQKRWPAIKVVVALEPKVILCGIDSISQFFRQNGYFVQQFDRHGSQIQSLQRHINTEIVHYMQSLFWHPMLTYQYSFHTNLSSYADISTNYNIFGILGKNSIIIVRRLFSNLVSIARENQRYRKSKEKFTTNIKELEGIYLKNNPFFGGKKPNHVDFYLMAQLKTKSGCRPFLIFLEDEIGGQFWRWWVRISNLCSYDRQRITTL